MWKVNGWKMETREVWDGGEKTRVSPAGGGVPCIYFPAILAAKPPSLHQSYQFPDDVGISLGTPLDPQWIRLEIHYSNFHNLPGECLERLQTSPWMGWLSPLGIDAGGPLTPARSPTLAFPGLFLCSL